MNQSRSDQCRCPNGCHSVWCNRWQTYRLPIFPICAQCRAGDVYCDRIEL